MIFLFILKQLHVLETKGCTLYRRALQLLEVRLYAVAQRNVIDSCHHTVDSQHNCSFIALLGICGIIQGIV